MRSRSDMQRDRRQFGRPIGSFQAVQQHLVTIAQQTALAGVAADATARRPHGFEIAAGKLLANRAALTAGRAAHQVLGARGTTREHPLGALTCRLWAWRSEYGDEHHWSTRLGAAVARAGADEPLPGDHRRLRGRERVRPEIDRPVLSG